MVEAAKRGDAPQEVPKRPGFLMQRLRAKARANDVPLHMMLELTNHCNLWCRHCYISDRPPRGELTLDELKDILDQLAAEGALFLTFSGGEPLVRKDFFQIAAYARKKEFAFTLFSNGTLITPEVADRLQELCPQRVEISLLGGKASTHDGITQVRGSFDRALRGARLLIERGIKVQLKTTWMRENIEESEQILSLVDEMGASFRGASLVIHRRDGGAETADLRATVDQLRAMTQRSYDQNPDVKRIPPDPVPLTEEQKQNMSPCGAGQTSCRIDSYGNVYPCAALDIMLGSLGEETFATIWHSSEELEKVRAIRVSDLTECSSCDLFLRCNRCAGLARMETGSLLGPSPQACMTAHAFEAFYEEKRCELH
ncbi:MAG: radical SAM protein [Anaerolineae bacterium]|nr:radical SAM protein [Anaerolineae bacterium]